MTKDLVDKDKFEIGVTHDLSSEICYVGETARPWRERVREHQLNLKNGDPKSFIICHWMDKHPTIMEAPDFKWQVVETYGDALRRQLCEGLFIMEAGVLNKRAEFHNNLICRMSASTSQEWSEKELQRALEGKKDYCMKIKKFINVMSELSTVINIKEKKKRNLSNPLLCSRYKTGDQPLITTVIKRKRAAMDSSTPLSLRREAIIMEMEDESPIDRDKSSSSSSYNTSSDVVPDEKSRAGISNELDSVAVTPPRDLSLETYEKKLALHAKAIADAAENNSSVPELQELSGQVLDMDVNPFARKNNGEPGHVRSVGMNGMNKTPEGENLLDGVVGMDGMNKSPGGGKVINGLLV